MWKNINRKQFSIAILALLALISTTDNTKAEQNIINNSNSIFYSSIESTNNNYELSLVDKIENLPRGDKAKLFNNIGKFYNYKGLTSLAFYYFNKSMSINPYETEPYCNMAETYIKQGDTKKAITILKKSLKFNPNNSRTYKTLASICIGQEDYDQAKNYLSKVLAIRPLTAEDYYYKGMAYKKLGKSKKAILNLMISLSKDHSDFRVYRDLGLIYFEDKKYKIAENCLKDALNLNPNITEAYLNLGYIYESQKKYKLAAKNYKKAIELNMDQKVYAYSKSQKSKENNINIASKHFEQSFDFESEIKQAKKTIDKIK